MKSNKNIQLKSAIENTKFYIYLYTKDVVYDHVIRKLAKAASYLIFFCLKLEKILEP